MKLSEALAKINAPKGLTSIIEGIHNNDYSVLPKEPVLQTSIEEAEKNIALYRQQIKDCKSDWSYWSIQGDLAYWESVLDILRAAQLVGPDNLPDVDREPGVVVMDEISSVRNFGLEILKRAQKVNSLLPSPEPHSISSNQDGKEQTPSDWKEALSEWEDKKVLPKVSEYALEWIEKQVVAPLQSKLEAAEEDNERISDLLLRCNIEEGSLKERSIHYQRLSRKLQSELSAAKEEIQKLEQWKREAIAVMPDMQRIGKLIGVPLGQSVHDKIIPFLEKITQPR